MLVRSQRLALLAIGFPSAFALISPTVVAALSVTVPFALGHDEPIVGISRLRLRGGQSDAACSRSDHHPAPHGRFFRVCAHYRAFGKCLTLTPQPLSRRQRGASCGKRLVSHVPNSQ